MEDSVLPIIIIAGIINLALMFAIFFYAVKMANKPLNRYLRILINMKAEELSKADIDPQKPIDKVDELDRLIKLRSSEQITSEQFNKEAEKYLV
jgi:hypothetical protein